MEGTKPVTNSTLKTMLIVVLLVAVVTLAAVVVRKQTVQLTISEDGQIATGEIKSHWKLPKKAA